MAFMVPLVSLVAVLAVSLFGLQNQPGAAKSLALLPVEQARQNGPSCPIPEGVELRVLVSIH